MGNVKASSREQDVRLYCGAVIRNIRNKKEFSFQTLYEETCGKKNPNKAYRLRDALLAKKYIIKHSDGSYSLKHENNDSDKIVADVMEYMKKHPIRSKKDESPKEESKKPDLLEGVEISPNPQRMEDEVLDGYDKKSGEWTKLPESTQEIKERNPLFELLDEIDPFVIMEYLKEKASKSRLGIEIGIK